MEYWSCRCRHHQQCSSALPFGPLDGSEGAETFVCSTCGNFPTLWLWRKKLPVFAGAYLL
jgi:hypothetical protein